MNRRRKSINGICVVEWLSTKSLEKKLSVVKRSAIVNIGIRLDNPDKFLARMVEVQLDLVGGRSDRFITSELNLFNEVLVRVLGHLSALIRIKEYVIHIERCSNKRLLVSSRNSDGSCSSASKGLDSPQALSNGTEINVNLDFVVLEGNKRKGKSWVSAEPEKEGNVESGLRKSLAWGTNLSRSSRSGTWSRNIGKCGVSDVGKLGGVTNHLVVTLLLLRGHGELVPDVHPVTVLAINSLTSNFDLNLSNELLSREVQPAGIDTIIIATTSGQKALVNLRKSDLKICAVSKITISGDCACYTATKVSLSRECLFNAFHSKVGVSAV
jgi:hypothetical protein